MSNDSDCAIAFIIMIGCGLICGCFFYLNEYSDRTSSETYNYLSENSNITIESHTISGLGPNIYETVLFKSSYYYPIKCLYLLKLDTGEIVGIANINMFTTISKAKDRAKYGDDEYIVSIGDIALNGHYNLKIHRCLWYGRQVAWINNCNFDENNNNNNNIVGVDTTLSTKKISNSNLRNDELIYPTIFLNYKNRSD